MDRSEPLRKPAVPIRVMMSVILISISKSRQLAPPQTCRPLGWGRHQHHKAPSVGTGQGVISGSVAVRLGNEPDQMMPIQNLHVRTGRCISVSRKVALMERVTACAGTCDQRPCQHGHRNPVQRGIVVQRSIGRICAFDQQAHYADSASGQSARH
jgi:hypothetical protein